jgi:dTDP-4-dehydrorhamnose reductase
MSDRNGVWLLGDRGMLGRQIAVELQKNGFAFSASDREVDIGDTESLEAFCRGKNISWIINCAAYTDVDQAEAESEAAFRVNARGVENLAKLAAKLGARLVHFSTDYVFDGRARRPYGENDAPRPLSQYGASKWQGEQLLTANWQSVFIFRVSWLYGVFGKNFVNTMLRLFREKNEVRVVNDQFGSPTYARTLASNIVRLVDSDSERFGLYHYCDRGVISWYDFAVHIMERALECKLLDKTIPLLPIPSVDFPSLAVRPAYTALDSSRAVSELAFDVRDWQISLDDFFNEKARWEKETR